MQAQIKKYIFKLVCWLAISFVFSSCAQIVIPSGGKKDIGAPHVVRYIPDSAATNFKGKNITIDFDEYIQLGDLQKELTISPPMRIQPEVKAKGTMLQIELQDTLKKNTTYVLNFGNAIRDFTESNIKKDFQYIFSTGSFIDTFQLSGMIKNAYDQKAEKGVSILLYETFEDSLPYKSGPSYFAKTNDDGNYRITNIRAGTYKAFALKDANGNSRYDVPTETIGFSDTLVKISRSSRLDLQVFREEPKKQRLLKSATWGYASIMLMYAKPVSEISYKPLNGTTKIETFLTEFNTSRDSLRIWFPVFTKDTLHFQATPDGGITDTIRLSTAQFKKDGGGRGEFKLTAAINAGKDKPLELNKPLTLKFSYPIKTARTNDIYVTSKKQKIGYTNTTIADKINRTFSFQFPLQQDSVYQLLLLPGTFTDIFGSLNDTIRTEFKLQEEKQYGTMKLKLIMQIRIAHIMQFTNEKGVIFEPESSDKTIFSYTFLPPGNYTLKIIYDKNGDGKWTPGNYTSRTQSEKVVYYSNPINIRSNWDSEIEWTVE